MLSPPSYQSTANASLYDRVPAEHDTTDVADASLIVHAESSSESCCRCCHCERCLTHCWFFLACCGFVLLSSLPRLLAIIDFIVTVLIYSLAKRAEPSLSFWEFLKDDFTHYSFTSSGASLLILSFLRTIILFIVFAYRFHLRRFSFYIPTIVVSLSTLFVLIKVVLNNNSSLIPLLIWSLCFPLVEIVVYLALRRQRIKQPRLIPTSTATSSTINSSGSRDKYQRLSEDEQKEVMKIHIHTPIATTSTPLAINNNDAELDPHSLADVDSLFLSVDNLSIHYKLVRNGVPVTSASASAANGVVAQQTSGTTPSSLPSSSSSSSFAASSSSSSQPRLSHAVILLHGFGGSVFQFRAIWSQLSSLVSTVVAFDRPGFGLSSRLLPINGSWGSYIQQESSAVDGATKGQMREQQNPYTQEYQVELTLKIMERLNIERAVLIGHSTGATIALRVAIRSPSAVNACVCIAPQVTAGFPGFLQSMFKSRLGKPMLQQLVRSELGEVTLRRAWYNEHNIPPELSAFYQRMHKVKNSHESLVEMASASSVKFQLSKHFADIRCPVLILHGVADKLVALSESTRAYHAMVSQGVNVQLVPLEHAAHVPHEEQPDIIMHYVGYFLREIVTHELSPSPLIKPAAESPVLLDDQASDL